MTQMPDRLQEFVKRQIADMLNATLPKDKFVVTTFDTASNTGAFVVIDDPCCDYMFHRFTVYWDCQLDGKMGFYGHISFLPYGPGFGGKNEAGDSRLYHFGLDRSFGEALQGIESEIVQWMNENDE